MTTSYYSRIIVDPVTGDTSNLRERYILPVTSTIGTVWIVPNIIGTGTTFTIPVNVPDEEKDEVPPKPTNPDFFAPRRRVLRF